MSAKAGIQLVDFKQKSLTDSVESTISGVYKSIVNSNGKPTLVCGLVVGTTVYPSFFVPFVDVSDIMTGVIDIAGTILKIEVADDDGVTVTDITPTP